MPLQREGWIHFIRFLIVGGISTAVNYAVFYILLGLGLQYQWASACGFVAGVLVGFPLNKAWTYGDSSRMTAAVLYSYIAVYLTSLIINIAAITMLVDFARIEPRIANFVTIIITTMTNFLGTKFWVFRK
ncbi:GtrA family protein [Asaia spathodeae]|uniref:GtrA family protein n=1 Tax=Asaia spathodeae TaxID=657016 RepID=UPI002FC305D3